MSSKTDAVPAAATSFDPALDPAKNLTDYASDAYLQRGRMLDKEVRDLVEQVDLSNKYLDEINKLIAEANTVIFGTSTTSSTTWQADFSGTDKTITLDNGYGIAIKPNGNIVITDASNNSVTYSAGALFPAQAGSGPGNGIVIGNTTLVLDDGTKITFQAGDSNVLTSMVLTRGNQGLSVTGLNTTPVASGPNLNGITLDSDHPDGDILVENSGLHNLVQAGTNVPFYGIASGTLTEDQKTFIRDKLKITNINLDGTLSDETWNALKSQLIAARDNLTGSNQLQTVQLQSALTRYNQNYDAMSNSQNKIYALLKDILGNLK
ncbi:DUF1521 domain-containing protein [Endozoicomonas sp. Mp262]|uniref:DUF1521 domain-containing protein n=1 Tax=Endozoicomonas sp. Mp262 TaxID=2919499 RepID=UPI0021E011FC